MGWYHFQLMDGKTPEEVEADMMCTDGTCTVRPASNNGTRMAGQHQVAELGSAGVELKCQPHSEPLS